MPTPQVQTIGQLIVKDILPADVQSDRVLDKKGVADLFDDLARRYPDQYVDILHKLNSFSEDAATTYGEGSSIRLSDLRLPPAVKSYRASLKKRIHGITQSDIPMEQKNAKLVDLMRNSVSEIQSRVLDESYGRGNTFAHTAKHGIKGNPGQLSQILFGDIMVTDHKGRPIAVPGVHGYGEGVPLSEYWAGSYAARSGYTCLTGDTLVRMSDYTVKRIEDIQAGDTVLGADMQGYTFPVKVLNRFFNGTREVFRYNFRTGRYRSREVQIEATEEHNVLGVVKNGKSTPNLRIPSKLPLSYAGRCFGMVPAKYPKRMIAEDVSGESLLIGCLVGDGCLTGSSGGSVTLTSADTTLIDSLREHVSDKWCLKALIRNRKSGMPSYEYMVMDIQKNRVLFKKSSIRKALEKLGLFGKKSFEKILPADILKWSDKDIQSFIYGYFEADGSVAAATTPGLSFCSTSYILLKGLQDILESRFGIYCSAISVRKRESVPQSHSYGYTINAARDCYTLRISNRDSVVCFNNMINKKMGAKGRKLDMLLSQMEDCFRDDAIVFGFIDKEFMGPLPVYDLEVDHKDHLYVLANGMVVSNSVQFATADTGYLGKQLAMLANRVRVTGEDCGASGVGVTTSGDDAENLGRVLVDDIGNIKSGTVIDKEHLPVLAGREILTRSLLTCQQEDGVCSKCAGQQYDGKFPETGEFIGIRAARAVAEPLVQQIGLSAKHTGTTVGAEKKDISGFPEINRFLQVPERFASASVLASASGKVTRIMDAPQGGKYILVGDKQLHAPPGRDVIVKEGESVEAGDMLTDGTPNPVEVAGYKGLGEGRRYFTEKFNEILQGNNVKSHRSNIEVLGKAFFDRVRINSDDGFGDYTRGDIVPYSVIQRSYVPREDSETLKPERAVGGYLEKPVLHYSIGTPITKKLAGDFQRRGIGEVIINRNPPGFEPAPVRLAGFASQDPDWKTRMAGTGLQKSLLEGVAYGASSPHKTTSYVPGLMNPARMQ